MKKVLFLAILIMGVFVSCNKDTNNLEDEKLKDYGAEASKEDCLILEYPIIYIMPDGSEIQITSEQDKEGWQSIKAWYESNPGSQEKPSMQYPINANFKGKALTIVNDEELKKLKKMCKGEKEDCFVLLFPISYIMPDGSVITIESKEDIESWEEIKAWYTANPGSDEKPLMEYPVKAKMSKDGSIKTINNEEEYAALKEYCKNTGKP